VNLACAGSSLYRRLDLGIRRPGKVPRRRICTNPERHLEGRVTTSSARDGSVSHTRPMNRRSLPGVLILLASILLLADCGTSTVAATAPKSACSLMTVNEAAAIFPIGTHQLDSRPPGGSQSYCSYPGHLAGVMLLSNLSWSTKEIATFSRLHSKAVHVARGTLPTGATVAPQFAKLIIDGTPVYWLARTPFPIGGTSTYPSQMSALKDGYLVFLTSTGLTQEQNRLAMRTMLNRL
jgi:hypothetical protein